MVCINCNRGGLLESIGLKIRSIYPSDFYDDWVRCLGIANRLQWKSPFHRGLMQGSIRPKADVSAQQQLNCIMLVKNAKKQAASPCRRRCEAVFTKALTPLHDAWFCIVSGSRRLKESWEILAISAGGLLTFRVFRLGTHGQRMWFNGQAALYALAGNTV